MKTKILGVNSPKHIKVFMEMLALMNHHEAETPILIIGRRKFAAFRYHNVHGYQWTSISEPEKDINEDAVWLIIDDFDMIKIIEELEPVENPDLYYPES